MAQKTINGTVIYEGCGLVRYWSVYQQVWCEAQYQDDIPDEEYAAMSMEEREAVLTELSLTRADAEEEYAAEVAAEERANA